MDWKVNEGECKMQRKPLSNFCFLLATLLILVAGCELPPTMVHPPIITSKKDGAVMIFIPAGKFLMGSPEGEGSDDEHPPHEVFLNAFYIDKYEVTNAQYKLFTDATGHPGSHLWNDEEYNHLDQPMVAATWRDAVAYAEWAGKRLPTEAEWEKSARGTDSRKYPWGNEWDGSKCNYRAWVGDGHYRIYLALVGSFPDGASPYGVMDMAGNVLEWCADWYDKDYYSQSPPVNPKGPDTGSSRVLRGGGADDNSYQLRCAHRDNEGPGTSGLYIGFRCVQDVTP